MDRCFLFRGKRKDNGKWVEGMLCQFYDGIGAKIAPNDFGTFESSIAWVVDPSTVGQYTGLTDKNGVKIFEGDIIKSHYARYTKHDFKEFVVFHKGRFCATPDNECFWSIFGEYMERCEVIGNIYDNKGLLNGGKNE